MKAGKSMRKVCVGLLAGGLMLSLFASATPPSPMNIQVTINNSRPTCDITVPPGAIDLSILKRDGAEYSHNPFRVNISCQGEIKTALTANRNNGTLLNGDNKSLAVSVEGNKPDTTHGPILKLRVNNNGVNKDVNLDNSEEFCISANPPGSGNINYCEITPVTRVNKGAPAGVGRATITFTIAYPT